MSWLKLKELAAKHETQGAMSVQEFMQARANCLGDVAAIVSTLDSVITEWVAAKQDYALKWGAFNSFPMREWGYEDCEKARTAYRVADDRLKCAELALYRALTGVS